MIRRGLSRLSPEPADDGGALSRRGFLRATGLAATGAVVATAGATVPLARTVSPLSLRSDRGPQGLPVNRTAAAAGVLDAARDPGWRLEIVSPGGARRLSRDELAALPQTTIELPIACVEGWSQSATWTGVRMADLLRDPRTVRVISLERNGLYAVSVLPAEHAADPATLLALRLNGEVLDLDHGFPCRIIAPNRPGVLQTKWVHRLEVQ